MAGDHAAAEAAYRDALEIDPNNTAARQHIGGDAPARPSGEAPASEAAADKPAGGDDFNFDILADPTKPALRVSVEGGGCSGFQYALAFDKAKDDDHVFEVDGVAVIVDKVSMQFVFGSEVDYVEGLTGAGFQVNNPNVVAACGCGSSFQVKDDAETAAAV